MHLLIIHLKDDSYPEFNLDQCQVSYQLSVLPISAVEVTFNSNN